MGTGKEHTYEFSPIVVTFNDIFAAKKVNEGNFGYTNKFDKASNILVKYDHTLWYREGARRMFSILDALKNKGDEQSFGEFRNGAFLLMENLCHRLIFIVPHTICAMALCSLFSNLDLFGPKYKPLSDIVS